MSETNNELLPIGTQVQVRDGAAEPPLRFKNKHAEWRTKNYDGVVVEHDEHVPGTYVIQTNLEFAPAAVFRLLAVQPRKVTAIAGATLVPVTGTKSSAMVDITAWREMQATANAAAA